METMPQPAFRRTTVESKQRIKVSKIHFLVHPGYLLHVQKYFRTSESDEDFEEKYNKLLSSYRKQAQNLPQNEIVVVISHEHKMVFKNAIKRDQAFAAILKDIKGILGRRCIVISQKTVSFDPGREFKITDEGMIKLNDIISSRGFDFNENTLTEAYGEMFASCVHSVGNSINEKGGFVNPTNINTSLTDIGASEISVPKERLTPEYIIGLNKRYKHTKTEI